MSWRPLTLVAALFVALCTSSARAADTSHDDTTRVHPTRDLTRLEDAADRLPPTDARRAYLDLRGRAAELTASASAPAGLVERISAKLRLAEARAAATTPGFPERLAFSRQAAAVGERHLDDGDPERALFWERVCREIEPRSTYAPALHTRIHGWFESELRARLDAGDASAARATLRRWRTLMGDDHATRGGEAAYVTRRAEAIRELLMRLGPRRALAALADEAGRFPSRPEWGTLRREVGGALQKPFDAAIVEQDTGRASTTLAAQRAYVDEFPALGGIVPIEDNQVRLDDLEELLQPVPLLRPFGHVRHPTFALTLAGASAATGFRDRAESVDSTETALTASLLFRQRASGTKRFAGAEVCGVDLAASDGTSSASALVVRANYLFGTVGRSHTARAGVGIAYAAIEYTGLALSDRGSGAVYGNLAASFDRAIGKSFVASGDVQLAWTDDLATAAASLSLIYHANANFAVGLRAFAARIRAEDKATALDLEVDASGVGVITKVQF